MKTIRVALGERGYDVLIGHGLLDQSGERLAPYARRGRLVVVTDETVWAAQGARLTAGLGRIEAVPVVLPPGEGSKSWAALEALVERLLALGVERDDPVVAFGGGVIGDLAGFAAAIVKRGCKLIQIPTTLLAQVDSSVGGKTGINSASGKNLVGAFHQPALVLIDPACLATLEPRQMRAGYAEIVKYALIEDRPFFDRLEAPGASMLDGDADSLTSAIATAVAGKARIVSEDERETNGRRALLNLGHTFGHALEAETGFCERLLHGEAIAVGMALAFDLSVELGLCAPEDALRVSKHLAAADLPTTLEAVGLRGRAQALLGHMRLDKKSRDGRIVLILARGIGRAVVAGDVEAAEIEAFLDRHR
jgi:3-dehydroquinate synthase